MPGLPRLRDSLPFRRALRALGGSGARGNRASNPAALVCALAARFFFRKLLPSRLNLGIVGTALYLYQASGLKWLVRVLGFLPAKLRDIESLSPEIEAPFFFPYYGKTLAAEGPQRYRVAFLGGCMANICFARLNEATVRVLRKNGCEVSIPEAQTCCGALHVHAGSG